MEESGENEQSPIPPHQGGQLISMPLANIANADASPEQLE